MAQRLNTFDDITGRHNIEKINTNGYAYLVVEGLDLAKPNHTWDVVTAAKEIIGFSVQRKQKKFF